MKKTRLRSARDSVATGITATPGGLDGITAGTFAAGSTARLDQSKLSNLPNLSAQFLIQPTTITATGFTCAPATLSTPCPCRLRCAVVP